MSSWAVLFYLSNCLNLIFFPSVFAHSLYLRKKEGLPALRMQFCFVAEKNSALFLHLVSISMSAYFECIPTGFKGGEAFVTKTMSDTIGITRPFACTCNCSSSPFYKPQY